MFNKRDAISVFEIGNNLVKLAQFARLDGRQLLVKLLAQATQTDKQEDLIKTLRNLATTHKIQTTRVLVCLARHKATVKNIKLPSVNPREIEGMLGLQAAKQLPFPPEVIAYSYKVLHKDKSGYSDVMMVLSHRDSVDAFVKSFSRAGIEVDRLLLSSEAIVEWYAQRQKEEEKKATVCLIDIGSSIIEAQVIANGRFCFTRSVSFANPFDLEARLVDEIKKSIYTYKKTGQGDEISKFVLTGKRLLVKKDAIMLREAFKIPMVYIDVLKSCPKRDNAVMLKESEIEKESFTAILSLGLNHHRLEANLMPADIQIKKISKVFRESLYIATALFLSVVLGIGGMITKNFVDKAKYLSLLGNRLNEIRPRVEKLTRLKEITQIVKVQLDAEGSSIDVLRELYRKMPPEISLSIFDYEESKSCLLRGTSSKLSDVFKFISTLEESPYFENVKVRYATKRVIRKEEFTDFEIICTLEKKR